MMLLADQSTGGVVNLHGPWWVALIPLLPLAGACLAGLCAALGVRSKLPAWLSVGCLGLAFVVTVGMYASLSGSVTVSTVFRWIEVEWPGGSIAADFGFYTDSLTCLWMLFVTGLATLIALYASEYMSGDVGKGYSRFFAAFNLFVFSMSCLVMGDNLLLLFLGWEGVGLCSYLLIGYFYKKPSAVEAAKKAFIVNRIGDLGLTLGVMLAYVKFGSLEYRVLFEAIGPYVELAKAGRWAEIPLSVELIPILLMIGAFGKSAQLPLYVWLPDAMEGPTPVSALIHAATMVTAGVYLIARTYPFFVASEHALGVVAWVGALTALLAATIGMAQFDIKRIMAYSTVSQLGYMFAGLGVLTSVGAAFHVFTHAFFKALLFLACGAVMHGFAGQLDLRKLSGVRRMPGWRIVGVTMLVGCLNLAGFPLLTSGYWSKDMILAESFTTPGFGMVGWILLATAGLTAYYTFRVYFRVFEGPSQFEPGEEHHGDDGHDDGHGDGSHAEPGVSHARGTGPDHAHGSGQGTGHGAAHGGFHPHPPGWAINLVLATLAVLTFVPIPLYLMDKAHHGWVGALVHDSTAAFESPYSHHAEPAPGHGGEGYGTKGDARATGTFLGMDPHAAMYYVSGVVGLAGIGIAFVLHLKGRTSAATSRADALLPRLGPIPRWAQRKWYVDEMYEWLVRRPLWVASHLFHYVDQLLVDGLVNLSGWLPRGMARVIRPSQGGVLHAYALGMAGGIGMLIFIVWLMH